jgi:hypothetical protein
MQADLGSPLVTYRNSALALDFGKISQGKSRRLGCQGLQAGFQKGNFADAKA